MENKFTVLGVDFDMATARELFKRTVEYLRGEALGTVEAVTKEMLIQGQEDEKDNDYEDVCFLCHRPERRQIVTLLMLM